MILYFILYAILSLITIVIAFIRGYSIGNNSKLKEINELTHQIDVMRIERNKFIKKIRKEREKHE